MRQIGLYTRVAIGHVVAHNLARHSSSVLSFHLPSFLTFSRGYNYREDNQRYVLPKRK